MKLILANFVFLMTGCATIIGAFGGEFSFRVTGSIPIIDSETNDCDLNMVDVKSGRKVFRDEKISNYFLVHYMLGAGAKKYYFVATCEDGRTFRSREVVLGGSNSSNYYKSPLDIGTLVEIP